MRRGRFLPMMQRLSYFRKRWYTAFPLVLSIFSLTMPSLAENLYVQAATAGSTGNNVLQIVDSTTFGVLASFTLPPPLPVGGAYEELAVTPGGGKIYLCVRSVVAVITPSMNSVVELPYDCGDIAVSPDGSKVYVTRASNSVSVLSSDSDTLAATIALNAPAHGIVVTPNGNRAYIDGAGGVLVVDTQANTQIGTVPGITGGDMRKMAVTPDGRFVYIPGTSSFAVFVVDTNTNTLIAEIPATAPVSVAITPDSAHAYVGTGFSSAFVVDTSTNAVVATLGAPVGNQNIGISSDGSRAYVYDNVDFADTVYVVDTITNNITTSFPIAFNTVPGTIAVSPPQITAQQATQNIINNVSNLVSQGALNSGEGNSLATKLQAAINQLNNGNSKAARGQINSFINEVNALINSGILSS